MIRLVFFCSYPPYDFKSPGERAVHHIISLGALQRIQYTAPFRLFSTHIISTLLGQRERNMRGKIPLLFVWLVLVLFDNWLCSASRLEPEAGRQARRSTWGIILAFTVLCSFFVCVVLLVLMMVEGCMVSGRTFGHALVLYPRSKDCGK